MGSKQSKPGVDWNAIRIGFEAGTSIRQLARDHAPLTHRAIQKRRDKEGWSVKAATLNAIPRLPSVIAQETGQSITVHRSAEKAKSVLESLQLGLPYRTAAILAGMSPDTLDNWRNDDSEFAQLCESSIEDWHKRTIGKVDAAADRGDWKAAQWRLGTHTKTREQYADKGGAGQSININLNIGRSDQDKPSITIEGTRAE